MIVKDGETWTNLNISEIFPPGVAVSTNAISWGSFGKIYIGTSMGLVIYIGGEIKNVCSCKRLTIANGLHSNM